MVGIRVVVFVEVQLLCHAAVVEFTTKVLLNISSNDVVAFLQYFCAYFQFNGVGAGGPIFCFVEQVAIYPDAITVVVKDVQNIFGSGMNFVEVEVAAEPEVCALTTRPFCSHSSIWKGSPVTDWHHGFRPLGIVEVCLRPAKRLCPSVDLHVLDAVAPFVGVVAPIVIGCASPELTSFCLVVNADVGERDCGIVFLGSESEGNLGVI